jgi:acetoacetyl-CoA synthetase
MSETPPILWEPPDALVQRARLTEFMGWLRDERGIDHDDYQALWQWSVDDLDGFWRAIWDFFGVRSPDAPSATLGERSMPGTEWFPGTRLNYAEHLFRDKPDDRVAILHASERRELAEMTWGELRDMTARIRAGLVRAGVERGDRVAAYLPNIPETIAALLATASLGAIWSSAAPEFGAKSVVDRFAQIEPKVLLTVDGYRYNGRDHDRTEVVAQLEREIPSLERVFTLGYIDPEADAGNWDELVGEPGELAFEPVPFDHPLWVLYSSGTTGLPKAIVQGQGGILLEHLKKLNLHTDLHEGDRLFWFTTTGWMMWNFLVAGLLSDAAIVLYDGSPGVDEMNVLWDLAERTGMTCFGTSAGYIAACMKAGVEPSAGRDLSALRAVGSTGSPLSPEGFDWIYEHVGRDTWLFSTSGGTDVCTAFVGGVVTLPVYRGELQGRSLGAAIEAYDEDGNPVIEEVGELVITEPMPSMPLYFWGDEDGERYRESYFDMFPGVWRHGDWIRITPRGTAVIYGRSDSTINRGGVRMGTSEIYSAVLGLDEVVDALVVDVPDEQGDAWMPLFVVLRDGVSLDDDLVKQIRTRVREDCSPRHVPDEVREIKEVPRTLSGKALEIPVKKILMGTAPDAAASRESLANPESLEYFIELAGAAKG